MSFTSRQWVARLDRAGDVSRSTLPPSTSSKPLQDRATQVMEDEVMEEQPRTPKYRRHAPGSGWPRTSCNGSGGKREGGGE